jgi:hypothetical protein
VTIEVQPETGGVPVFANLTYISIGGCYLETSAILSPGSKIGLGFSMEDGTLKHEGVVVRLDPGSGVAVQFREANREGRERMFKILEVVQKTNAYYNNRYFENMIKR